MNKSESITELAKAQSAMQAELMDIAKDSKGYGYKYTSLDALVKYLRPLLSKHGLSFLQTPIGGDGQIGVETIWMHSSGEWIESRFVSNVESLKGMNLYQAVGSAITYYRRYSIASFCGIASDDDMDGTSGKGEAKASSNGSW